MAESLTVLTALVGGGLTLWGFGRYVRSRFSRGDSARRVGRRRVGLTVVALGGLLLIAPDLPAAVLTDPAPQVSGVDAVASTVGWWLWRLMVLAYLGSLSVAMFLLSDTVTRPVRRAFGAGREVVVRAAYAAPLGPGREVRSLRRRPDLRGFPRGWDEAVAHERALTARLLQYERDPELAANRPAMRDYADPATAAAVRAMLAADVARLAGPPVRAVDVLATDYGRAVAEFAAALDAAEANATLRATSDLHDGERAALDEAGRILAFLGHNATTPAERTAAYEQVTQILRGAAWHTPAGAAVTRTHPWLDVADRAR